MSINRQAMTEDQIRKDERIKCAQELRAYALWYGKNADDDETVAKKAAALDILAASHKLRDGVLEHLGMIE